MDIPLYAEYVDESKEDHKEWQNKKNIYIGALLRA
jgi:hypothetical protein